MVQKWKKLLHSEKILSLLSPIPLVPARPILPVVCLPKYPYANLNIFLFPLLHKM